MKAELKSEKKTIKLNWKHNLKKQWNRWVLSICSFVCWLHYFVHNEILKVCFLSFVCPPLYYIRPNVRQWNPLLILLIKFILIAQTAPFPFWSDETGILCSKCWQRGYEEKLGTEYTNFDWLPFNSVWLYI